MQHTLEFTGEVDSVDTERKKEGTKTRVYIHFAGMVAPFNWPKGAPVPDPGDPVSVTVNLPPVVAPTPEPNPWNDWLGGDEPPHDARGKLVDIVFGNLCEEKGVPADAYDWSHADPDDIHFHEIKRYRVSAEQLEA